jgi:predicted dehydrogenase
MKVGLIGCGGVANLHMRVYKSMKNVDVVGVCDLNVDRAKALASKFGVPKAFADYNDLFETKDLNFVDICTPVSTHARIICDTARRVPAILVEKPLALTLNECDKVVAEVKKNGSKLCVSHQQIFLPAIEKAKLLIDKGAYKLASFRTLQKESFEILKTHGLAADWMVRPEQRGIIWEVCSHLAYLQLHFLPDIEEVCAVGSKVKYPTYDHFAVLLRTRGETFGLIDLSWVSNETEIVYELCDSQGKRAQIYRDFDYFSERGAYPPLSARGVASGFFAEEKRTLQKWFKFGVNYIRKDRLIPHLKLISSYFTSIEKNLPPPVPPEEGRKTIQLLECIEKSLDEHQPIKLDSINK